MSTIVRPVRVSTKGQIVIPQEIRKQLGARPGKTLVMVARGEGEAVLMTPERYAVALEGIAGGIYGRTRKEIEGYIRRERQGWQG